MNSRPRIIVVGAGIIGASIAWHLSKAGASVTVIGASGAGGVATPNSFAWINASWGNPEPYFRLRVRSMAAWRRLAEMVPGLPLTQTGGLRWDLPTDEMESYVRQHGGWGYGIRKVSRAVLLQIEPNLADPPEMALHVIEEGAAEPRAAAQVLLADAERNGARLQLNSLVLELIQQGSRTVGVRTEAGFLAADEIVLAAGGRTAELAATAGIQVPLSMPPGILVYTKPHARLINSVLVSPGLELRQTVDGRVIASADFGTGDQVRGAGAVAQDLFAKVTAMLEGADDLVFDHHLIGYRPMPSDGFPIVGRARGHDGLYVAVTHSGITLAPAIGMFVAEEILLCRRDPLLSPYSLARFA
ncbi:MAG TPA: FAD-binding oxidoreductase [Geminicoccus sp.]|jgi:glycine/D-amino acid oxidase-like deaminating enzyme|uniref:NAD(P)/FAD-dependent oxidoreductase n=1 Tax=Geminicoccus sp. TaxID=2024832 RepID=UPI002E37CA44|nr:FAD-binding oxidoreductase [Geminicoccus sp.]HEX2526889.1 FAD-binding oxidoreductase [Geminicoccus sp.]